MNKNMLKEDLKKFEELNELKTLWDEASLHGSKTEENRIRYKFLCEKYDYVKRTYSELELEIASLKNHYADLLKQERDNFFKEQMNSYINELRELITKIKELEEKDAVELLNKYIQNYAIAYKISSSKLQ